MLKLFILGISFIILVGCNNSTSEPLQHDINKASSSSSLNSSSGSFNSSNDGSIVLSSSVEEVNSSLLIEGLILDKFLDTPIRIIDNASDLNVLYSDLNIQKNENQSIIIVFLSIFSAYLIVDKEPLDTTPSGINDTT